MFNSQAIVLYKNDRKAYKTKYAGAKHKIRVKSKPHTCKINKRKTMMNTN